MAEINDLVPIDDNNTARWPEGMAPSAVNDAGRADEGILSRWHRDTNGSLTSAGTASAYTLTTNQSLSAYYDGLEISFVANVTCTDNPTLQLGGLTAAEIKTADDQKVSAGDIPSGSVVNVVSQDNATTPTWRLMNVPAGSQLAQKVITTRGDIIRGDSNGDRERLALGAAGLVLTSDGTDVLYQAVALPRGFVDGFVTANNSTDAVNDLDIAAGQCRDDTNTANIDLASGLTKRLDATWSAGTNQGGLDTGTKAADTWYHVFAIKNPTTDSVDILFSTSATSPTLPSGYTLQRRIWSFRTNATSEILPYIQFQNRCHWETPVNESATFTTDGLKTLSYVPLGHRTEARLTVHIEENNVGNTTDASALVRLGEHTATRTPSAFGDAAQTSNGVYQSAPNGGSLDVGVTIQTDILINTAQQFQWDISGGSGGTPSVAVHSYVDYRGANA